MKTARNMKGRIGTFLLALVTVFGTLMPTTAAFAADDGADAPYYYDGVYQGTAEGYRSDVTLQVTVKDHKIANVEVLSQEETRSYWRKASVLIDEIVKQQTTDLDAVSGATLSSDAILNAAKIALDQALTDPNSPFVSGDGEKTSRLTRAALPVHSATTASSRTMLHSVQSTLLLRRARTSGEWQAE